MQLTRLRLSGFKSFSDPAELAIEGGLTGIVGPNGCGKSNIVEALRWAMGESSARGLRGEEMDDVIFNGSSGRPAFDVAEVRLRLTGPATALPELQDAAEIEVARRIARGQGSVYRINGREVRARDVQLLFADAGAGTRSASVIGQGQIGFVVESRPQERRRLLEEAAGIGGLHARRRDAEQRLAATEANLQRLLDVLREQEARLAELERQDRQAERYRKVSAELRAAETLHLLARFRAAERHLAEAEAAEQAARRDVGEAAGRAAALRREHRRIGEHLPSRREEVAALAARLAALAERRAQLAAAAEQRRTHRATLARQLAELASDRSGAEERARTLTAEIAGLEAERASVAAELEVLEAKLPSAGAAEAAAAADLGAGEAAQRELLTELARAEAALRHAQGGLEGARARLGTLDAALSAVASAERAGGGPEPLPLDAAVAEHEAARLRVEEAEALLGTREGEADAARRTAEAAAGTAAARRDELSAAEAKVRESEAAALRLGEALRTLERAEARLAERERAHAARVDAHRAAIAVTDIPGLEAALAAAERALKEADERLDAARARAARAETAHAAEATAAREAQRALDALRAELGLLSTLAVEVAESALLHRVRIPERLTRAVAAALADDLLAGDDPESDLYWRALDAEGKPAPLPEGALPLHEQIEAPPVLARTLSQAGIVPVGEGAALQPRLRPGQRLVSEDGDLWRWDGLVRTAAAEGAGAARVRHRLRLEAARRECAELEAALAAAVRAEATAAESLALCRQELAGIESVWRGADTAQAGARQGLLAGRERQRELSGESERLAAEGEALRRERAELEEERAALADPAAARSAAAAARSGRDAARAAAETAERARREAALRVEAAERALGAGRRLASEARRTQELARDALERRRREAEAAARAAAEAAAERRARAEALAAERGDLVRALAGMAGGHAAAAAAAGEARTRAAAAEEAVAQARSRRETAVRELSHLRERARGLETRQAEIVAALAAGAARLTESREQAAAAALRASRLQGEIDALGETLAQGGDAALAEEMAGLELRHREAAGELATAEAGLGGLEAELSAAETAAGRARETLALALAERARAGAALKSAADLVQERLQHPAGTLLSDPQLAAQVDAADPGEVEARLTRLRLARERIGPVNLRAGVEMEEVREALARTRAEEEELRAAIGRLKQATARLSREGRERLEAVFTVVDRHFRELFVRLFGGGRAQLRLIDAEDPLQAGLELEACPPGKKLASISLLSGGEKTLTALALVFAFFLASPAPLCVLDEADAPLDDANVDRFVSLMREIAQGTGTRFLAVTHHPLTMARMDRLYGVTMSEHGVSRLVSVALEDAVAMRATA